MSTSTDWLAGLAGWLAGWQISGVLERNTATQEPPCGQRSDEWQLKLNTIILY